jgi:hypothetical protein
MSSLPKSCSAARALWAWQRSVRLSAVVFGVAQFVDAIGVEARAGARPMDAARLDLAEVSKEGAEQLVGAADETARGREQLGVGELVGRRVPAGGERGDGVRARVHAREATPRFFQARIRALANDRSLGRYSSRLHPESLARSRICAYERPRRERSKVSDGSPQGRIKNEMEIPPARERTE